jgi:hypothetical protein
VKGPGILLKLAGTDRRSIGRADELVADVLADLALADERYYSHVKGLLEDLLETGSPAMQSRGRKLLARLQEGT